MPTEVKPSSSSKCDLESTEANPSASDLVAGRAEAVRTVKYIDDRRSVEYDITPYLLTPEKELVIRPLLVLQKATPTEEETLGLLPPRGFTRYSVRDPERLHINWAPKPSHHDDGEAPYRNKYNMSKSTLYCLGGLTLFAITLISVSAAFLEK